MIYWYQDKLRPHFETVAKVMVILTAFAIPMSTAVMSIATALLFLFWILSGNFGQKFRTVGHNPIVLWALGLFLLLAIGLSYTSAESEAALSSFGKYKKLLFIPIILSLALTEKWQRSAIYAFAIAMTIILFISYLKYFGVVALTGSTGEEYTVFKGRIAHGIFMAFYFYMMVQFAIYRKPWRWLFLILASLACYNLLFINVGRSGYVVFASLVFFLFYQRFKWKGLVGAFLALTMLMTFAFFTSDGFRARITESVNDVRVHVPGEYNHYSGLRYRLEYYQTTLKIIKKNVLVGHGTGSLAAEFKIIADQEGLRTTDNPHNEFMMITSQIGLVGLFVLCGMLYSQWRASLSLDVEYRHILQGVLVTMISGSMLNSLLLDSGEGKFYVILVAIFLSTSVLQNKKVIDD